MGNRKVENGCAWVLGVIMVQAAMACVVLWHIRHGGHTVTACRIASVVGTCRQVPLAVMHRSQESDQRLLLSPWIAT